MKSVILTIAFLLLISEGCNCQWYYKRYGVKDINQLSDEQLSESLTKARTGVSGGCVISIIGAIGICAGNYLIIHSKNVYPDANDITNLQLAGGALLVLSIPIELAGLIDLGINHNRLKSIKKVITESELKTGFVNYQWVNESSGVQQSLLPNLSLTIYF